MELLNALSGIAEFVRRLVVMPDDYIWIISTRITRTINVYNASIPDVVLQLLT